MAVLDTAANEIVIRVVYDGPPEAGKTTSVHALAASLRQPTATPEGNPSGRTPWFDWMEYVGGRFEGNEIRCQVLSVPGQRELHGRRRALLASADVVVFVGDSTPARWELSMEYLFELKRMLAADAAPVSVVFQANKRDAPGAVELAALQRRLGEVGWSIGIVESIAADGTGIREAFVYAVRVALDRVRALMAQERLARGAAEIATPAQLLAQLRGAEARAPARGRTAAAADSMGAVLLREAATVPQPPDASVPSGAIWPAVEGRAILCEVSALGLAARALPSGDCIAGLGSGWRLASARAAAFASLDAGREALVAWARLHAACRDAVSPCRCIVLAATGDGRWRLWQIVRAERTLRDFAGGAAAEPSPERAAARLCDAAAYLLDAHARLAALACDLPCSLDTIGPIDGVALYSGLMPAEPAAPRAAAPPTGAALVAAELGPLVELDLAHRRPELARALARIPHRTARADQVLAAVGALLR